ncbi:LptE family protein [Chryseolinea sp. T2]|uniref:LptE family protein n=1 Tax=Chryseolinea sp. T2 TaxID=3129255 RepID=UPI00307806D5
MNQMPRTAIKRLSRLTAPGVWSFSIVLLLSLFCGGCGVGIKYGMSGQTTTASTITISEFYNNTDLGQANIGQTFTNQLKNYVIQNSNVSVVAENGELLLEGEISNYQITPIAPVATSNPNQANLASSTRLTITVKASYVNTLDESMSFSDKTFSFYKDFPNTQNITDVEEQYTRQIFERIVNDIFNASVANW